MDYIPRRDADFDGWFENLTHYVASHAVSSGPPPKWTHIPQAKVQELDARYTAWHAAYEKITGPHTDVDTQVKNTERGHAEGFLRPFVKQFLKYDPVTDADRLAMRLHIEDATRTPSGKITAAVDAENDSSAIRESTWHYWVKGSASRAKAEHAHGVECAWALLDHAPVNVEELVHRVIDTASPLTLRFTEEDRGRRVYCCFRWIGSVEGHEGAWSEFFSAVIP